MNPVSTPLEMSAASIRLAGYVIESNLRVAHVIGQAALSSNPFAAPADVRKRAAGAKRVSGKETQKSEAKEVAPKKPSKPVKVAETSRTKPTETVTSKPANKTKSTKLATVKAEEPANTPASAEAKTQPEIKAKTASKPSAGPTTLKSVAKQAAKPATKTPEFKSRAARSATPSSPESAKVEKPLSPAVASADQKAVAPTKKAQPENSQAASKGHRAPSTPPAMPAREKVSDKD